MIDRSSYRLSRAMWLNRLKQAKADGDRVVEGSCLRMLAQLRRMVILDHDA